MKSYTIALVMALSLCLLAAGVAIGWIAHRPAEPPTRAAVLLDCGSPTWVVLESGGTLYIASWNEIRRQPTLTDWFTQAVVTRRAVGCGASL